MHITGDRRALPGIGLQTLGVPAHNGEVLRGSTALLTHPCMRERDALDFADGVLCAGALGILFEREVFGHRPNESLHAREPRLSDLFQATFCKVRWRQPAAKPLGSLGPVCFKAIIRVQSALRTLGWCCCL